jgi:hypothetical protein
MRTTLCILAVAAPIVGSVVVYFLLGGAHTP